jgi:hypothetical protein
MFCGHAGQLDGFCFWWKRIEMRRVEYARDSYRDEFFDVPPQFYSHIPPRSYSRASSRTFSRASLRTFSRACLTLLLVLCLSSLMDPTITHGFGPRENRFVPRCFGYGSRPRHGDRFPHRPGFSAGGSFTHFEPRHLDGPRFPHRGSCPTRPNGELERIVKTSFGRMIKCWIPKIYLTNPSMEPSTPSRPM